MRFPLGISGCLLAGCAMQPATSDPRWSQPLAPASARPSFPSPLADAASPPATFAVRIGVEHLPPEVNAVPESPRSEPLVKDRGHRRAHERETNHRTRANERPLLELATSDNPLAHEALHFVSDLVQADRQRVRREVGLPFFDFYGVDPNRGPLLTSEQALLEDHELWVQEHGTALLQRPMRQLLRRLPIVSDLELELEDFRSDHVPLSEPYVEAHAQRRRLDRVSLRIHASDLSDPVEVVYIHSFLRVGTSQEIGKVTIDVPLVSELQLEWRGRTEYATGEIGMRLDFSYRASTATSVHVAVGDDMDFLSTSSMYSLFESPMDGSPGLVLYAVHIF